MLPGSSQTNLWPVRCTDCPGKSWRSIKANEIQNRMKLWVIVANLCFSDNVRVYTDAENDSSQEGESRSYLWKLFISLMVEIGRFSSLLYLTVCVSLQGPEFIQFLQQEYLPSLQVSPEITQVSCHSSVVICVWLNFIAQKLWFIAILTFYFFNI